MVTKKQNFNCSLCGIEYYEAPFKINKKKFCHNCFKALPKENIKKLLEGQEI
jgi:hypothetical protein